MCRSWNRWTGLKNIETETRIAQFPIDSISQKTIQWKVYQYHYYHWYEGKKYKEKYLPKEEVDSLR